MNGNLKARKRGSIGSGEGKIQVTALFKTFRVILPDENMTCEVQFKELNSLMEAIEWDKTGMTSKQDMA